MPVQPPVMIEEMTVLYYADVTEYAAQLKKYMPAVPQWFVVVYYEEDKSYCILGTDESFNRWEEYTNYVFKELSPALAFPHVIFRIDNFKWTKV